MPALGLVHACYSCASDMRTGDIRAARFLSEHVTWVQCYIQGRNYATMSRCITAVIICSGGAHRKEGICLLSNMRTLASSVSISERFEMVEDEIKLSTWQARGTATTRVPRVPVPGTCCPSSGSSSSRNKRPFPTARFLTSRNQPG